MLSHRLFFALRPDAETSHAIASAMAVLKDATAVRHRPLKLANLHLTLHFLGDFAEYPHELAERAKIVAGTVDFPPFEFVLDRIVSFRGRNQSPWVLRSAPDSETDLRDFWQQLGAALTQAGLGAELESRFTPHATIAYGDAQLPAPIAIVPVRWRVREFVLIDSHLGRAHHEVLAEWGLA
jgi:2'-5' RNA ligase